MVYVTRNHTCPVCGKTIKSMGLARHRSMHYEHTQESKNLLIFIVNKAKDRGQSWLKFQHIERTPRGDHRLVAFFFDHVYNFTINFTIAKEAISLMVKKRDPSGLAHAVESILDTIDEFEIEK